MKAKTKLIALCGFLLCNLILSSCSKQIHYVRSFEPVSAAAINNTAKQDTLSNVAVMAACYDALKYNQNELSKCQRAQTNNVKVAQKQRSVYKATFAAINSFWVALFILKR